MHPASFQPVEAVTARLLASPILQEYDASTVDEVAMHPAEFGTLAAKHNLVEIAEACRREWTLAQWLGLAIATAAAGSC